MLLAPLMRDEADAVFGSPMIDKQAARRGYKSVKRGAPEKSSAKVGLASRVFCSKHLCPWPAGMAREDRALPGLDSLLAQEERAGT